MIRMKRTAGSLTAMAVLLSIATACGTAPPAPSSSPTPSAIVPHSPSPTLSHSPFPTSTPPPSPSPAGNPPTPSQAPPAEDQNLPASLVGTEWTTLPTSKKVVALTFDAGANNAGVASILETLAAKDVRGTFFLTGKWTELYGDDAREIASRFPVANHTVSHPYLTTLSDRAVRSEIEEAGEMIRAATGRDDRPLFRFPYGDSDARTIGLANDLGYGGIRWTVDTVGWKGTSGGESVDRIVERVLGALRPGAIVLMHVGSHPEDESTLDADALPRMIDAIRARGYGFVTVDQYV